MNRVTYVINRTGPSRVENKSPYESWNRKKPNVASLKTIGSSCYTHIPKQKRQKLSKKAYKGILVGYDNVDGHRVWAATENNKYWLVRSRDVIFVEKPLYRANTEIEMRQITPDTKANELDIKIVSTEHHSVFKYGQMVPPRSCVKLTQLQSSLGRKGRSKIRQMESTVHLWLRKNQKFDVTTWWCTEWKICSSCSRICCRRQILWYRAA